MRATETAAWAAWAAGLFEGEGCFFVNKIRKHGCVYRYPCASLKMTDEDVVRRFHTVVGVGKVWRKPEPREGWKPLWDWRCHGHNDTLYVLTLLKPYLGARRQETARKVFGDGPPPLPKKPPVHGTRAKQRTGCRCVQCRAFHAARIRKQRSKKGNHQR